MGKKISYVIFCIIHTYYIPSSEIQKYSKKNAGYETFGTILCTYLQIFIVLIFQGLLQLPHMYF